MSKTPKNPAQVQREFRASGVTVAQWARLNGFNRMTIVDLLRGRVAGNYGEAHRAAVALGLKQGEVVDPKRFKPAKVVR